MATAERESLARGRVRRLLDAAAEVASDAALVEPLCESTGLSAEGVRLALSRHLETDAGEAEVAALVAGAAPSPHVHVILSANVFTAPLRALAVACAASPSVSVRPSRRDPVFTRALLRAAPGVGVTLVEHADVGAVAVGDVHVYGRDETIAQVRAAARPGVTVRAHGAGLGVAWVGHAADLEGAASALADDVVVFDQRGCLSPRVAFVQGDEERGVRFVAALGAWLSELGRTVPRGRLDPDERRAAARYAEAMTFAGRVVRGADHLVALGPTGGPLIVPPPGRHVHVLVVRDVEEARAVLGPVLRLVVAVGSDDTAAATHLVADATRGRFSALGRMQRPPFDGPVDLR